MKDKRAEVRARSRGANDKPDRETRQTGHSRTARRALDSAAEALGLVLRFEFPADAVLSRYFQQHHALGQHDRAFVAESVYGVLRHMRVIERLAGDPTPRRLVLAW